MNRFDRLIKGTIFFFAMSTLYAQPNYIYEGGNGGGFSSMVEMGVSLNFYEGGNGDGFSSLVEMGVSLNFYEGGNGDGFSSLVEMGVSLNFYEGGNGDGFSSLSKTGVSLHFYEGGTSSGYTSDQEVYQGVTFYEGDIGQGYDIVEKCEDFIWTGMMGTGWGASGNWNYNIVPDIKRSVIIPAGAPNYPNVNAGIFAIGDNPNNGTFECKSMWIQDGGLVITKINSYVENYGEILIDGNMRVKNSAANAIRNLENGEIRISSAGALIIKP